MQAMYDDYGDNGYIPLALNITENMETVVKVHARRYTYPVLRDGGSAWNTYKQGNYIPTNYVVDADGIIRYIYVGWSEQAMRTIIREYLPNPIDQDVGTKVVLMPIGSADSGQTYVPACSVFNYGLRSETYPVRMKIGNDYNEAITVSGHLPNTARYVEFPSWTALARGQTAVTCSTELDGDDIKSNNAAGTTVTVYVYDLAVLEILAPKDSADSGAVVVPSARVANLGNYADMAKVKFYIGGLYTDSVTVALQPGNVKTATLRGWTASQVGEFPVRCSVSGRKDMILSNNLLTGTIRVVRRTGIKEATGTCPARTFRVEPNPFRNAVSFGLSVSGYAELNIVDASGRLVRTLPAYDIEHGAYSVTWDGRDESGIPVRPGVYYCCLRSGSGTEVQKLVRTE